MKEKKQRHEIRKQNAILLPLTKEEKNEIQKNAMLTGLPTTVYLRRIALGYPVHAKIDREQIAKMSKINADLGRLGGLLKFWLTDEEKRQGREDQIRKILHGIESAQSELQAALKKL